MTNIDWRTVSLNCNVEAIKMTFFLDFGHDDGVSL